MHSFIYVDYSGLFICKNYRICLYLLEIIKTISFFKINGKQNNKLFFNFPRLDFGNFDAGGSDKRIYFSIRPCTRQLKFKMERKNKKKRKVHPDDSKALINHGMEMDHRDEMDRGYRTYFYYFVYTIVHIYLSLTYIGYTFFY